MFTLGEKPGAGNYKCTTCGSKIKLKNPEDLLPACNKCNNVEFKKVKISKKERFFAEIFSLIFWIFLIFKIFVYDIDNYIIHTHLPTFSWILNFKLFILIGFLALFWLLLKSKKFFALILFILIYPFFFIFWRVPKFLFKTKNWLGVYAVIGVSVAFLKSIKLNFVVFTLVLFSGLLIMVTNSKYTLIPSIIILFLFLILHFGRRFSYGFKKFDVLSKYANSVMKFYQKVQNTIKDAEVQQATEKDATEEGKKASEEFNRLQWLLIFNKGCHFMTSKLRYLQKSGIIFLSYSIKLFYSFFLVIFIFAFQYFALYKIDPNSFSGHPKGKLIYFFYYSFNTLFTNSVADFHPESSFAKLFSTVEIFFGLLILVILFFLLFTIVREKHKTEIDESILALERQGSELEKIVDTEYQMTIQQALDEVEKMKGSMLKIIYYFMSNIN